MTDKRPDVREIFEDIIRRNPLAERDVVIELLCCPVASNISNRFDGTQWVRQIIRATGIAFDRRDEDRFIKDAYIEMDPSSDEINNHPSWAQFRECQSQIDTTKTGAESVCEEENIIANYMALHKLEVPRFQLDVEKTTDAVALEVTDQEKKLSSIRELEEYVLASDQEETVKLGAEIIYLALEEGLGLQMDQFILSFLMWSENGVRPCHYDEL